MTSDVRDDRRVRRTKERLHSALMTLILEIGYDKITVQNLIDRADVGRSTFYAHYATKDELLLSGLDHLKADIEQHMADDPSATEMIIPGLGIFRHVADHHELFNAMIGSRGIDIVNKLALETITEVALSAIMRRAADGEKSNIPPEARAAYAAGSLMAFLTWWLDNAMPYKPEILDDMYRQMTASI